MSDALARSLEYEFRAFLHPFGRDAPRLRDFQLYRNDYRFTHVLSLRFHGHDREHSIEIAEELFRQLSGAAIFGIYSRAYEDHLVDLDLRQARDELHEIIRRAPRADIAEAPIRRYREFEEHVRRHHRQHEPVRYVGIDWASADTGARIDLAPVAVNLALPDFEASGEAYRRFVERMDTDIRRTFLWGDWGTSDIGDQQAQDKALALLKACLTPAQRAEYEAEKHFEVIGSDTGKRYRIRHGRQMNIDELDKSGRKVGGWCFLPEGNLAAGDCMLAQKIALETAEKAALKVANRVGGPAPDVAMSRDLIERAYRSIGAWADGA
jgi:hypothetical protein